MKQRLRQISFNDNWTIVLKNLLREVAQQQQQLEIHVFFKPLKRLLSVQQLTFERDNLDLKSSSLASIKDKKLFSHYSTNLSLRIYKFILEALSGWQIAVHKVGRKMFLCYLMLCCCLSCVNNVFNICLHYQFIFAYHCHWSKASWIHIYAKNTFSFNEDEK